MQNLSLKDGIAQLAQSITDNQSTCVEQELNSKFNNPESNISYVVTYQTITFGNPDSKYKINEQKEIQFKGRRAIDSRRKAFGFDISLMGNDINSTKNSGDIQAPLHNDGIDNNRTTLFRWWRIDCVNELTGERINLIDTEFPYPPYGTFDTYAMELKWYDEFGYSTEYEVIKVKNELGIEYAILDYQMGEFDENQEKLTEFDKDARRVEDAIEQFVFEMSLEVSPKSFQAYRNLEIYLKKFCESKGHFLYWRLLGDKYEQEWQDFMQKTNLSDYAIKRCICAKRTFMKWCRKNHITNVLDSLVP